MPGRPSLNEEDDDAEDILAHEDFDEFSGNIWNPI